MPHPNEPPDTRPKNREVENEMLCPPEKEGQPPRPVTEPKQKDKNTGKED